MLDALAHAPSSITISPRKNFLTCTRTHIHTRTYTRTHTNHTHAHARTRTHTHTHAHTHAHTHTRTRTLTHVQHTGMTTRAYLEQHHTFIGIYGVYTVFLAGKSPSPYIRSYTVCIHGSGQLYTCAYLEQHHTLTGIYGVYTVFLAGKSPRFWPTLHMCLL